MKQLRESIMSDVNVNTDIKESARKVKNSKEVVAAVQKMDKIIKSNILWLVYQQGKIFEEFKANDKFVNVVNQFSVIKFMMVIKISIVRFLN